MVMTESQLVAKLKELLSLPDETECVEFKEAKRSFDFRKLCKYFSALCNEANLKSQMFSWLVFGVNKHHEIVGTNFRPNHKDLNSLKKEIADVMIPRITFIEIHELLLPGGRVILFQIPSSPKGIPVSYNGHYYARDNESLVALNLQEIDQIRSQTIQEDWSAQNCENASISDLDINAIARARELFKSKYPGQESEVDNWDNTKFLNKLKITKQGKITNTALILLGNEEADFHLVPAIAKISWFLKSENNTDEDYEHFGIPLLLSTEKVFNKIRNKRYRYITDDTLFPTELPTYEPYVIRECLHNCIAHQDYMLRGRINVIEFPDKLIFTNVGSFIPGSVERVIEMDIPPERYRNTYLAEAMVKLNMIDIQGGGIRKMYNIQKKRCFPLPDYDLDEDEKVKTTIYGCILNEDYTRLLKTNPDLPLKTVMYMDKIQKGFKVTKEIAKMLHNKKIVEGRYPNIYLKPKVGDIYDNEKYKELIINLIKRNKSANRDDIDNLLIDKLPNYLNLKQKRTKIRNILFKMSKEDKTIKNTASTKKPNWVEVKKRKKTK
jgi:ATP-dependent DNA helicase RecG